MIEGKGVMNVSPKVESSTINSSLLDALRDRKGFSLERYGSLDQTLEELEEQLTPLIGRFVGREVELKLMDVVLYSGAENTADESDVSTIARINGRNDQLVGFVGMENSVFRSVLSMLLGSYNQQSSLQDQAMLSAGECKLFLRFVQQISAALFNALKANLSDDSDEARLEVSTVDIKNLIALSGKTQIVSITFELSLNDAKKHLKILAPLELLESGNQTASETEMANLRRCEEEIWKEKLQARINQLPIPLRAQIVSTKMLLADVAHLVPGCMLDVQFDLSNVKIIDGDENCAFLSDIEFNKNSTQLRVAQVSTSKGV